MPNPFPGVDPYIESSDWENFHVYFTTILALTLNRQLSPELLARPEDRCYIVPRFDVPRRYLLPDATLARNSRVSQSPDGDSALSQPRVATEIAQPTVTLQNAFLHLVQEDVKEHYVEIRRAGDDQPVITAIELLSPSNKTEGHQGRDSYMKKQAEVLKSYTNLVEIDLLRGGTPTVCVNAGSLRDYGSWDHIVTLHRAARPDEASVYLNRLRDSLPLIRIPLREGEDDVILDLQALYLECYEGGRFGRLNYADEPKPPLSPDDALWADALLREKGLR